jgi:hypothetical protein
MRAALDWLEVESAKQNPQTQDIAPWMETSNIGSIPVPSLNSPLPPTLATSSHPPGKILSSSGARPIPIKPVQVEDIRYDRMLRWRQIALLSILFGSLLFAGYWWDSRRSTNDTTLPLVPDPSAAHGE